MTYEEAEAEARELNRELGAQGDEQSFYVMAEVTPGDWRVEKRTEKKSWPERIIDALVNYPG